MRRLVALMLALAITAAACGGGSSESSAQKGADRASGPEKKTEPVVPGARWQRVDLAVGEGAVSVAAIAPIGDGFIAVGNHVPSDSVVAWRSDDGVAWEQVTIDNAGGAVGVGAQGFVPFVMAVRGDTVAVLGGNGGSCRGYICGQVDMVAWVSDDAGVTWRRAEGPPSFAAAAAMFPDEILLTEQGFLAIGHSDGGSVSDWRSPLWRSADGARWEDVTVLAKPGPMAGTSVVTTGDRLMVVGQEAFCTEPFLNGNFWVLGGPYVTRDRVWISDDGGSTWTERPAQELDSFEGAPDSQPPVCEPSDNEGMVASNSDVGTLYDAAGTVFALRKSDDGPNALWVTTDLESWDRASEAPFETGRGGSLDPRHVLALGGGFLALEVHENVLDDTYEVLMRHSSDGRRWKPVHDGTVLPDTPPPPPAGDDSTTFFAGKDAAVNGGTIVITAGVRSEADLGDAMFWVSRP